MSDPVPTEDAIEQSQPPKPSAKPLIAAEQLFQNRQKFKRFNQYKIDRCLKNLSEIDRLIFSAIPRLLHVHQEGLPGYIEGNVPHGIYNFRLNDEAKIAAEKLFPDVIMRRSENINPVIHTVLLMGSVGSIAQTKKSDLDYTLLIDKASFTPDSLSLFQKKLNAIETWTWDNYHLETHFFINDHQEVKQNIFGESDSESTGSALAKLLKEEMYRTMMINTGKIPFWWIVPVDTDDQRYDELYQLLNSGKTLLDKKEFIDIGNVDDISEGEFFGGSIWALIKSFKSPFKTLMKMGMLEEYMFNVTKSNLLCHQIKNMVFSRTDFMDIDAYLALFHRVETFFKETKSDNEVDALRTAFYLKVGTQINAEEYERGSDNLKKSTLIDIIRTWDWTPFKIEQLNNYSSWQMMQKVALGNRVNKILMSSYKNISDKNSTLDPSETLITQKDTHLLGRKLFSFYRSAPNKVENLFALVDGKTSENELTFLHERQDAKDKGTWYLIRGRTRAFLEQIDPENIIKKSATLPFLIAFTCYNNLYSPDTNLLLRAEGQSIKDDDLRSLLEQLSSFISAVNIAAISNEELLNDARVNQLFMITDFGTPPPMDVLVGNIKDCKTNEELNAFIGKRTEKIKSLSTIYMTSWGELFSKTYSGLNCMNRALAELSPSIIPEVLEDPNFLKVYIPSGRKEHIRIPWLNNYLSRSLKIRSMAFSEKAAS